MTKKAKKPTLTLAQFIETKSLSKLGALLDASPSAVYTWKHYITSPRPSQAAKLIKLSRNRLTWESIYSPYVAHKNKRLKKQAQTEKQLSLF